MRSNDNHGFQSSGTSWHEMNDAFSAHAAFHSYRLIVIAGWPESEYKQAALAAARAALQRELTFERATHTGGTPAGPAPGRVSATR